MSTGKGC